MMLPSSLATLLAATAFTAVTATVPIAPPQVVSPSLNTSNAVFRLIKGDDVGLLAESQKCLRRALAGSESYDEIVFHEGLSADLQAELERSTPNLKFVDVSADMAAEPADFPAGLDAAAVGYRQMCKFMAMSWFRALSRYSYAMRVDDDVCVQRFDEDPFRRMKREGLLYGYGLETTESHLETMDTMPSFLSAFAARHNIQLPSAEALIRNIFFTNFFVSRVDWWQSEDVQRFLGAVTDSDGVKVHRWGDAPVQTAALRLFAPADKVRRLPVSYLHASTMNRIHNDGSETDGWSDGEMARHPLVEEYAARRLSDAPLGSNSSNSSNVTALGGPEYFLLLEWQAEAGTESLAAELQAAIAEWAGRPPEDVTVTFTPLPAEDGQGDFGSGDSGSGSGGGGALVKVSVAIQFPTGEEAEQQLDNIAGLRAFLLADSSLPASAIGEPQGELLTLYSPPPPSPPPFSPPSFPPPSFPPGLPRAEYEALRDDSEGLDMAPGVFMAIAAGALVGTVLLALLLLRLTRTPKPLECSVVSHARLGSAMLHWGLLATRGRIAIVSAVLIGFAILAGLGLPQVEQEVGTASSWVPSGGRLESQLKDWETLVDNSVTDRSSAFILISSDREGENLLDDPLFWLDATLRTVKRAYAEATVPVVASEGSETLQLGWKDFCLSVNHPLLVDAIPPITEGTGDLWKPCINPSVLDNFREQMWEYNASDGEVGAQKAKAFEAIAEVGVLACGLSRLKGKGDAYCGQVNDASNYSSMYDLSREQIIQQLMKDSTQAGHWIAASSQPWGKLFGAYEGTNDASGESQLTYVKSFVYTLYQDIPKEVVKHRKSVKTLSPTQFRDANKEWLLALERVLEEIDSDEVNFPGVSVVYYPSDATDRMYEEVAGAQTGTIIIGYSVMLAFVVLSQLSWSRYTNMALLGVMGFVAILLANAAAYGFIALIGYKYNHTMMQALPFLALGLGVDDLFLLLHAFKATMRGHRGVRAEVAVGLTMMEAGASITITSFSISSVFFVACLIPIPALQSLLVSAGCIVLFNWVSAMTIFPAILSLWAGLFETRDLRETTTAEALETLSQTRAALRKKGGGAADGDGSGSGEPWWSPAELIARFYQFFSESLPAKLAFLLVGVGLLAGLAALIPLVEVGYKESDLAKKGSYLARGITAVNEQVFSQHLEELVVFGTGVDYTVDQARVIDTFNKLRETKWSAYGTSLGRTGSAANMWLPNMYESAGVCPHWNLYNDSVNPSWAFYDDYHLWRRPQVFLEPRYPPTFDYLSFGGLFAGLLYGVNEFPYSSAGGPDDYDSSNLIVMSWNRIEMDMTKLRKTEDKIQMVRDFKDITQASGLNIYMHGWLYVQLEQFLNLDKYFWQAAGISMLVVFAVALLIGMSWVSAGLIAAFAVVLCVEVYGSLYLFDISYQTLACTSMLMSIGISVEFVAHPVAAFEFAVGTRRERLAEAMRRTALPVLEGAISSFLGFAFLAASDFEFVTKYFFFIFLSICLFGTINALVFLPALLGLVGSDKKADDFRTSAADSARRSGVDVAPADGDEEAQVQVKPEEVKAKVKAPRWSPAWSPCFRDMSAVAPPTSASV